MSTYFIIFINSVVYVVFWVAVFLWCVFIIDKMFPWSLTKEIIEDENIALWIMMWCLFIAIAIIIWAAIHW